MDATTDDRARTAPYASLTREEQDRARALAREAARASDLTVRSGMPAWLERLSSYDTRREVFAQEVRYRMGIARRPQNAHERPPWDVPGWGRR